MQRVENIQNFKKKKRGKQNALGKPLTEEF